MTKPHLFKPGERPVGRAAGTPNKATAAVKAMAREHGPAAIQHLAELAGIVPGVPGADSGAAQVAALRELLDRAYGKPTQMIAGDDEGDPIRTAITVTFC